MRFTPPSHLDEYVQSTKYCDSESGEVKAKAEEIIQDADTPGDAALKIFLFVRDEFKFGFTPVDQKASETLQGNLGWCVNKTNLQIALLRSLGIPARYHQIALSKKSLEGIISKTLYKGMDERIGFHPGCECFIDDKWIVCDLFIDSYTYRAAIEKGLYDTAYFPSVDWDGQNDLIIVSHWLLEDIGIHASYDQVIDEVAAEFKKTPAIISKILVGISNRHTANLRKVVTGPAS